MESQASNKLQSGVIMTASSNELVHPVVLVVPQVKGVLFQKLNEIKTRNDFENNILMEEQRKLLKNPSNFSQNARELNETDLEQFWTNK